MNLLLDTHALLWWFDDNARLSRSARDAIAEPASLVFVSSASGWEIAIKHRNGKFPEAASLLRELPAALRRDRFESLPISIDHAVAAGALAGPHKDPFDRMLIAQARLEDLAVVTIDPVFRAYDLSVVW